MPIAVDTHALDYHPISELLITTILSALSVLVAFSFRDSVVQGIQIIAPNDLTKKFIFSLLVTLFFLFITVLVAYMFQNKYSS